MDIIFEQLLSISAKFSVFLDETIGWANSWKVLPMRPVLRHCFLVPYVLLSASGNASVPAMNLPILLFLENKDEFRSNFFDRSSLRMGLLFIGYIHLTAPVTVSGCAFGRRRIMQNW